MPPISMLIKPVSGSCNIRCGYCFYRDEQQNRKQESCGVMSEETLEILIKRALSEAEGFCSFGFQGGEPTLRGLDFFRRVVALQKKHNVKGLPISNSIQTNGLLIDQDWGDFLSQNHFLVGLSLDGTRDIHDRWRTDTQNEGTFHRVMAAARLLESCGVEFNILTVVTKQVADHITKIYNFYRRSGLFYQQYIPCLDPLGSPRGGEPYSLTPKKYAQFLKTLFGLWYQDLSQGKPIYIRYFENLLGMLSGRPPESCGMAGRCALQFVIEADGSVYPCDFYCLDQWRMGWIQESGFSQLADTPEAKRFLEEGVSRGEKCRGCSVYSICRGGCRRDWTAEGKSYYCEAFQEFLPTAAWTLHPNA